MFPCRDLLRMRAPGWRHPRRGRPPRARISSSSTSSRWRAHTSTAWRERIDALENRWFAPLLHALHGRRIGHIALVVPGETGCWRFDLAARDLMKFWRRPKPWTEYA